MLSLKITAKGTGHSHEHEQREAKFGLRRSGGGTMSKRIGVQTVALPSKPGLIGWAGIAGQKEKEGLTARNLIRSSRMS